jgi:hypothetical protein
MLEPMKLTHSLTCERIPSFGNERSGRRRPGSKHSIVLGPTIDGA